MDALEFVGIEHGWLCVCMFVGLVYCYLMIPADARSGRDDFIQ